MKKVVSVVVIVFILLTSIYVVYAENDDSETEVAAETEQVDNSEQIAAEPDEPSEEAVKEEVPDDTPENPEQKQSADVVQPIEVDSISTPRVEAGERVSFSIGFHAKETYRIKSIAIVTSVDMSVFPFELEKTSYLEKYDNVAEATYIVDLCARKEAEKGYYNLLFEVVYEDDGQEKCISFPIPVFVNQKDKEPEEKEPEKENPVAVPKVILTASRTEPEEIIAGEPFNLILTFKNTSSSNSVSSLKISLVPEAGKFTPQTGSANMFTSRLYAGQSKELSIELIPGTDLSPGYYMINMNLSYDTITESQVISATQAETVSLKVNQIPSVRITDMEISPDSITVGKEINFAFDLLNTGRSAIYNATVKIFCEGEYFKDSEVFLGNIDPGKAGIVDSYVTALLSGNAKVNLKVNYEDADGKVYTYENVKELHIGPRPSSESDIPVPQEEKGDLPIAAIIMSVASAGVVIYLLFVNKKKAKMAAYDDSFIDRIEEGKNRE